MLCDKSTKTRRRNQVPTLPSGIDFHIIFWDTFPVLLLRQHTTFQLERVWWLPHWALSNKNTLHLHGRIYAEESRDRLSVMSEVYQVLDSSLSPRAHRWACPYCGYTWLWMGVVTLISFLGTEAESIPHLHPWRHKAEILAAQGY